MQIAPTPVLPTSSPVPAQRSGGAEGFLAVLASLRGTPAIGEPAAKVAEKPESSGDSVETEDGAAELAVAPAALGQMPPATTPNEGETPEDAAGPQAAAGQIPARPQVATTQMTALPQAGVADLPDAAPAAIDFAAPRDAPAAPAPPAPEELPTATVPATEKPANSPAKAEVATAVPALQAAPDADDKGRGTDDAPTRNDSKPTVRAAAETISAADQRAGTAFAGFTSLDVPPEGDEDKAPAALTPVAETTAPHAAERTTHAPRLHPAAESAVSRQIAMAIERTTDGQTEIRLDPAELGRVRLTLHATDQTVTVTIHAERAETLDLIRRNIDSLTQDLRALGYADIGLNLGGGGNGQARTGPQAPQFDAPAVPPADDANLLRPAPARSGGLDLRL